MIKNIIKIATGFLIIVIVLIGYLPQPEYLVELTCISNTLGGLLLLADGIFNITKKKMRLNSFYFNVTVSLFTVFLVCMGSLTGLYHMNFHGAFFLMHVVNPVAFTAYYILFVKEQRHSVKEVITAPVMIMAYCLFDYIRYLFTGKFVYGFMDAEGFTFVWAVITGIVIYALMLLLSWILFALNKSIAPF